MIFGNINVHKIGISLIMESVPKVEILKRYYDMNVGIIGYGSMGKMLLQKINNNGNRL